jgi:serine/threonine protein phosphatase PrpC
MKSTLVMLAVMNNNMVFAHSGDSRLYYIHNNELVYYTEDHSVAFKKFKAGEIGRDQIGQDEDQSSLLRSIGGEDHNEPTIYNYPDKITPGDSFMLCSDGAWEYLKDAEVLIDRLKSRSAKEWTERLLLRIMDRVDGTNDNLSIVTLIVE